MAVAVSYKFPGVEDEVSKAKRKAGELRFHALLLLVAIVLGTLLEVSGPAWSRDVLAQVRINSLAGVAALLLALFASMLAHELGHLLAALFLNYEVLGGVIGPFRLEWWHNKPVIRLEEGNWTRCSISAVPREIHHGWRGRMMTVVAAGPIVTLVLLLTAAGVIFHGHTAKPEGTWLIALWSSCAEVNFFLFILGLMPNRRDASVRNDAGLFLSLWHKDADALDMFICHQAIDLSLRRIRPEDYPEALLLELAGFQGRPYTNLIVAQRMVEWAIDSGNLSLANQWDQSALAASAGCSPRLANRALAESACFDVMFREDRRSAMHKFAKVEFDKLFPPALAERAWAARLIACDLPDRAPAHILQAQYYLPLGNPYFNYERMLLDKLHIKALWQGRPGIVEC